MTDISWLAADGRMCWTLLLLRKGKVIVEAKYEKVEIKENYTALVTTITGKTQEITLE